MLREQIGDADAVAVIDAEITEKLGIIIVLDTFTMTARRLACPTFEQLCLYDAIPDRHVFLFREGESGNRFWRAVLSESESRFTASFELAPEGWPEEDVEVAEVFLSSSRDNEYFCLLKSGGDQPALRLEKVQVQIGSRISTVRRYDLRGKEVNDVYRASFEPDKFLVNGEREIAILGKDLACHAELSEEIQVYGINQRKSLLYLTYNARVYVCNLKLASQKILSQSFTMTFFSTCNVLGLCPETETALITLDSDHGIFYNLTNNKFSNQFELSKIVCTRAPSRWYYMDYDHGGRAMALKDITEEIDAIFEWHVLFDPENCEGDDEARVAYLLRLRDGEDVVHSLCSESA